MQCGSECGRVFVWAMDLEQQDSKRSAIRRFARKFKPSRALKSAESWIAASPPDKLTALAPAPWNPNKGSVGGTCTVTATLEGVVRMFNTTYKRSDTG